MKEETLKDLFLEQIQDLYDAERQLVKALPKIAEAVESPDLAEAIESHLEETKGQVKRLEEVFGMLDEKPKGVTCKAMKGLLEEGDEALKREEEGDIRDLAIIAAAQRVEHYEISAYGTARTMAERLGLSDAADLLRQTEDEEEQADSKLSDVADAIYDSAEEDEDDDEEEIEEEGEEESSTEKVTRAGRK
jgi:ferritin-like metal-binding protein YciE